LVYGVCNSPSDYHSAAVLSAAVQNSNSAPWAAPHLDAWRDAYEAFGAKPQRTPCSAKALRKRCERDGSLPPVNPIVDLYNAISLS
jgi:DNA/RNA-binding domain of Phe-tRNA-synthetase-like protein